MRLPTNLPNFWNRASRKTIRNAQRFPFTEGYDAFGVPDALPLLPMTLTYHDSLDTGASVSVLPYSIGLQLGADWDNQGTSVTLAGNLATVEARGLLLSAQIGHFAPTRLVFAWCLSDHVPLLLGRMNFFLEFDVCFYRSNLVFEVSSKS